MIAKVIVNGLVWVGSYSCIAAGFFAVWGVLNIINIMPRFDDHLGAYCGGCSPTRRSNPSLFGGAVIAAALLAFGYALQRIFINRVITRARLGQAGTLTCGLNLMLAMR